MNLYDVIQWTLVVIVIIVAIIYVIRRCRCGSSCCNCPGEKLCNRRKK